MCELWSVWPGLESDLRIRTLESLKSAGVETHLIISDGARRTLPIEARRSVEEVEAMASTVYDNHDLAAAVSSGSFARTA